MKYMTLSNVKSLEARLIPFLTAIISQLYEDGEDRIRLHGRPLVDLRSLKRLLDTGA